MIFGRWPLVENSEIYRTAPLAALDDARTLHNNGLRNGFRKKPITMATQNVGRWIGEFEN